MFNNKILRLKTIKAASPTFRTILTFKNKQEYALYKPSGSDSLQTADGYTFKVRG
jgi:hypothetical protein